MYANAIDTQKLSPELEESVRFVLTCSHPDVLNVLRQQMAENGTRPADVVVFGLEHLLTQPKHNRSSQVHSLLAIAGYLGINAPSLVDGGLTIAYHSEPHKQQPMGQLVWEIANAGGVEALEFEQTVRQMELRMKASQPQVSPQLSPVTSPQPSTPPALPSATSDIQKARKSLLARERTEAAMQTQSESDGDRLAADLEAFYCSPEVNIQIERYGAPIEGPRNWVCRFRSGRDPATKRKRIAKLTELRKWKEELVSEVGLTPGKIVIQSNAENGAGWTEFIIPKAKWEPCVFDQYEEQLCRDYSPTDHPELPIGVDFRGNLHWVKLKSLLVGGEPESGKSSFLKSLLAGMSLRYSPAFIQFQLVDLQEATFGHFDHYPWLWNSTVTQGSDLKSALDAISAEGATRQAEFAKYKVDKLSDYIAESGKSFPYLILLIDELQLAREVLDAQIKDEILIASEIGSDYEGRESFDDYLGHITRGLRKYGIYVVAATQRPEQTVVPKLVRDMFPLRLAFRVTSEGSSRVILGDRDRCENGAYLQGDGHCYLVEPKGEFWLQSLWIPKEDVVAIGDNGRNQFPGFVKQRKPRIRFYPTQPSSAASPSAPIRAEVEIVPQSDREDLSTDPDYSLYQKILALEPKVKKNPKKALGEISESEFLRKVFDMEQAPQGNSLYSCQNLVAELKQKFAGRTSHDHS